MLREAKRKCYPDEASISVTNIAAEVKLQSLVDHTVRRIIEVQKDVILQIFRDTSENVTMIYKWDCDESADHATYRQEFTNSEGKKIDEYMYAICLVPLQLNVDSNIVWQNSRPSSTRFCRPIKLLFDKESTPLIKKEIKSVKEQIENKFPTRIEEFNMNINHKFCLTMIDGKTCNFRIIVTVMWDLWSYAKNNE
ncbi:unnamed protein product [Psylliodes chrysocephalus]|uniref:V(D)J recombination-activating protein 1 RNase H domain-containing protein n=1 Tax=Psylliodes chrysocephalus TaxID=3402493 RepID=A0A9P0C8G7_9CUCU|nr:unnamed protein product [Psylliodes chrysocephala]